MLAYVPDLMDRSKVAGAAPDTTFVASPAELVAAAVAAIDSGADGGATLVVADLGRPGVLDALPAVVATGARVIGFGSHVERSTLEAAAATGCEAMPRSQFFRSLEDLTAG
ncbi:MAG: hypothetical protein ACR2G7_02810 [Acidimicrobiales bacterium]